MFTRFLDAPGGSFFLFGPRGSSYSGVETDLLCETARGFVALEIKASTRWDRRYNRGLQRISEELGPDRVTCYGVYQGDRPLTWDRVQVLPVSDFLQRLWGGEVLG